MDISSNIILNKDQDNQKEQYRRKKEDAGKILIINTLIDKNKKTLLKKQKNLEETPEYLNIKQEQINIKHEINQLKMQQKQLKEDMNTFDHDIELYKTFNKEKQKNPDFKIPELFNLKYKIMTKLELTNMLNFDSFKLEWDTIKPKNNYNLFTSTSYDEIFKSNTKKETPFEINLEI